MSAIISCLVPATVPWPELNLMHPNPSAETVGEISPLRPQSLDERYRRFAGCIEELCSKRNTHPVTQMPILESSFSRNRLPRAFASTCGARFPPLGTKSNHSP